MEFIKNFLVGAAKFVYGIFVAPIVEMKNIFSKDTTWGQKLIKLLCGVSNIVIIASWFFAVPALLVALAWVWFWLSIIVALAYVTIVMLSSSAGLAFLVMVGDRLNKSAAAEQQEAAAPAAA